MGRINIPRFLRNRLTNRPAGGSFLVLDIGTFSVKGLSVSDGKVTAFSSRQYLGSDMGGNVNVQVIVSACRAVVKNLKAVFGRGRFTNKAVLGIGGGFVYGKTITQSYIRDHPNGELSDGEFGNIIQRVQRKNFEQIRRDFKRETGRSELDIYLLGGALQDIRIDGYQVVSPLGFKGREVSCGLFNSYIAKEHLEKFAGIAGSLKLELLSVISEPYAVFSSLYDGNTPEADFILIDIGGSSTEISLVRKGRLDDVRSISMGGSSFTRSISENLKIEIWEAENIKRKLSEGAVARHVSRKIENIIMDDAKLFFRGFEMALSDLSQTTLLPPQIYVYGGGSIMPVISKVFKGTQWRNFLSFSSSPVISVLPPSKINCQLGTSGENVIWTVPFSLAAAHMGEIRDQDEVIKSVKRSLRLIQGQFPIPNLR